MLIFFSFANSNADEAENKEKDIVEKAKEINQKIKLQQAGVIDENSSSEEPLPLNDPFVGDASLAGNSTSLSGNVSQEELKYESYVSLINSSGEIMTLQLHEELSEGVKLVAIKPKEAVFQKEDTAYLIINFKNQIRESLEAF